MNELSRGQRGARTLKRIALACLGGLLVGALDAWQATSALELTPSEAGLAWALALLPLLLLGIAAGLALPRAWMAAVAGLGVPVLLVFVGHGGTWPTPSRWRPVGHHAPGPGVLLVTVDTARADRFSGKLRTPAHDRLAREGVRFTSAWAQIPVTGPSHGALLTGRAPWDNRMLFNGDPLPREITTLAEHLSHQGWDTAAFVSSAVLHRDLGHGRGFGVYSDDLSRWPGAGRTALGRWLLPEPPVERPARRTVDQALSWLDQPERSQRPWLCWVHLFDPHGPYEPPPPWDRAYYPRDRDPRDPSRRSLAEAHDVPAFLEPSLRGITDADWVEAQYDGEISEADHQVERLLDQLDRSMPSPPLVVLTADHGEGLGEHGEWYQHGGALWDHDLHVPLVIRSPGRLPAGVEVSEAVELGDVAPTLLELVGEPPLPAATGSSLLPMLLQNEQPPRPWARSMAWDEQTARDLGTQQSGGRTWRVASVRTAGHRYLVYEHPDRPLVILDDQGRSKQIPGAEDYLEVQEAQALLESWDASEHVQKTHLVDREALEALGYVER